MSNEKTGRRGKKRIWGKDDTELSLLALPTTIWYLLLLKVNGWDLTTLNSCFPQRISG